MTEIWLLLDMEWTPDPGNTAAWCEAFTSRDAALQALYGMYRGAESARLMWRRSRDGYYEAYDPAVPDRLWVLFAEMPMGADPDWREYGFQGDLPDLDHAPAEWPDEGAEAEEP